MNKSEKKVGFIGCGHMASAIIKGILEAKFLSPENVFASEINEEYANKKEQELKIKIFTDNKTLVQNSDVIVVATKPNCVKEVLEAVKKDISSEKLVVSIAAGVSTKKIEDALEKNISTIRVMPNGPAMVLEGMSGIAKGKFATEEDVNFVKELLSNIGECIVIDEAQIDIVTAISGSGPAFFYKIINEMARAGEKLGLDYKKSLLLAAQTAIGSAKLMMASELSAESLIEGISTKGGCTEVGVNYMNERKTDELFFNLIEKTAQKANELGK